MYLLYFSNLFYFILCFPYMHSSLNVKHGEHMDSDGPMNLMSPKVESTIIPFQEHWWRKTHITLGWNFNPGIDFSPTLQVFWVNYSFAHLDLEFMHIGYTVFSCYIVKRHELRLFSTQKRDEERLDLERFSYTAIAASRKVPVHLLKVQAETMNTKYHLSVSRTESFYPQP